jgi:large repetitive protein
VAGSGPVPAAPAPPGPPHLASIAVADPSTLTAGAVGVPGATVNLTAAVITDTSVEVASANPAALMVEGQGVTVPAGFSSVPLLVDVLEVARPYR